MRLNLFVHFLTLVVLNFSFIGKVLAAQDTSVVPLSINTKPTSPQLQYGPTLYKKRYMTDHTLTSSLGYWKGHLEDFYSVKSTTYLAFTQTNYNPNFTAQEYGLQLTDIGLVGAHAGIKSTPWLGENWEPFFKGSLGALFKPSESIGSIINFDRYQLQFTTGFEDLFSFHRKFRLELGFARSNMGYSYLVGLGYVIAD